ncbi:MAG: hypothetical protein H6R12_2517 [Proteobacteria bacterium]|nr:hypothetical protein [Pseudomonadota bacterium]
MKSTVRALLAVVAGMLVAFALVVAVEWFSSIVHPFPPDFDGNRVASRIGGRLAGALVTLLLASALAFNLSMLPYAMWFKIAMPAAFFVACLLGIRDGVRRRAGA